MHPALPFPATAALQTGFPAACLATAKLVWLMEPRLQRQRLLEHAPAGVERKHKTIVYTALALTGKKELVNLLRFKEVQIST